MISKGVGLRTRIMQVLEDSKLTNGYKKIQIIAMIRVNGKRSVINEYMDETWGCVTGR